MDPRPEADEPAPKQKRRKSKWRRVRGRTVDR